MFSHLGSLRACCLLSLVMLYPWRLPCQTTTDEPAELKPLRYDLTPLVGYRTSISFPTGEDAQEPTAHVVLEGGPSYGFAVGFRLEEEKLIEFRWARQDT